MVLPQYFIEVGAYIYGRIIIENNNWNINNIMKSIIVEALLLIWHTLQNMFVRKLQLIKMIKLYVTKIKLFVLLT